MAKPTHITAGRTAFRILLIAALLTTAVVGTTSTAAAAPLDGKGNDVCPCEPLSIGSGSLPIVDLTDPVGTLIVELATSWFQNIDTIVLATPSPN
jgi:hypothetical protein